jgi:hypothetical protein
MFRLITTVKRGSASTLVPTWRGYGTIEDARTAAAAVLCEDRVQRVMIVRAEPLGGFVEWRDR